MTQSSPRPDRRTFLQGAAAAAGSALPAQGSPSKTQNTSASSPPDLAPNEVREDLFLPEEVWRERMTPPEDGKRYEIIDGELFTTPAPKTRHQDLVREFIFAI